MDHLYFNRQLDLLLSVFLYIYQQPEEPLIEYTHDQLLDALKLFLMCDPDYRQAFTEWGIFFQKNSKRKFGI